MEYYTDTNLEEYPLLVLSAFRDAFNSWEGHNQSKAHAKRREKTTNKFGACPPGGVKGGNVPTWVS